jgi:predicted TIM-barrel enzyme
MNSKVVMQKLHTAVSMGSPIIVAGVGSGLTAKAAVAGGADMLAVYSTAILRIRGVPTALAFLPYDNANELTMTAAPEVLANAGDVPVILGFGAHDPRVPIEQLLDQAEAVRAAGVTNEPFLGLYSQDLRAQLEAAQLGFSRELVLLKRAVERGIVALGWAFSAEEARSIAETGAQIIGAMVGVTAGGPAGGTAMAPLDEAVEVVEAIVKAAKAVRGEVIVLGHGGPLNNPESVATILRRTGADGYVTGSTGERIPVEVGVAEAIRQFKSIDITSDD